MEICLIATGKSSAGRGSAVTGAQSTRCPHSTCPQRCVPRQGLCVPPPPPRAPCPLPKGSVCPLKGSVFPDPPAVAASPTSPGHSCPTLRFSSFLAGSGALTLFSGLSPAAHALEGFCAPCSASGLSSMSLPSCAVKPGLVHIWGHLHPLCPLALLCCSEMSLGLL